MKKIHFIAAFFLANAVFSQEAITAAGGDFSGSGGNIAYSVGQVNYTTNFSTSGSSSQGVQQTYQISTNDLAEYEGSNLFSVFPNPTSDFFNLKSNKNLIGSKYEILDNLGRIVLTGVLLNENQIVDMTELSRGIYNLQVMGASSKTLNFVKN
jgi:hypothetical protein